MSHIIAYTKEQLDWLNAAMQAHLDMQNSVALAEKAQYKAYQIIRSHEKAVAGVIRECAAHPRDGTAPGAASFNKALKEIDKTFKPAFKELLKHKLIRRWQIPDARSVYEHMTGKWK